MTLFCLALCAALLLAAVLVAVVARRRSAALLERLQAMLAAAMDGSFSETAFDESRMSALESQLSRYLSASAASARAVAAEKDRLKELVGDISHQTKTPLASLLLHGQLLAETPLPQNAAASVAAINAQAQKLQFLVDALVKLSRLESGVLTVSPKPGPAVPMAEAALAQALPAARKKGVSLSLLPGDARAVFDAKWTAEALYNLLDNAVKYTPAGGQVTVKIQSYELFCRIDVADTGIGIPEEEQGKIFARFYRSPAVHDAEGVGVGLYLARQIVSLEGGYLQVRSAPGQGSVFSLFLPQSTGGT